MPILDSLINAAKGLLGTSNEAMLRRIWPLVRQARTLEAALQGEDDVQLRARAKALRERVAKDGFDAILVEALALAREAGDRRLGMWRAIWPDGLAPFWKPVAEGDRFPDDGWGEARQLVEEARAKMRVERTQENPGPLPWDIDLPASVYARVRALHPDSLPPFRMRAHDVQVLGAIVLHQGRIAEMKTGEGKTLVAALCCFLNGLAGKGVHVITVNDYLASRDAAWNAPMLEFLGVSVGAIQSQMPPWLRQRMYACDVTYGTNNEFGFDYLRDNLAKSKEEQVQTRRSFAIVDEVDSVLVDEARTPLIISGPATGRKEHYEKADEVARALKPGEDFEVDIKDRHVTLTEKGMDRAAQLFGVANLYDPEAMHLPHFLDNALKAHQLFLKDKEYLVAGGQIKIVDEHTGRVLEGRRWSDGLHQAVECKEKVAIQEENQTYATITLQNFFRLYGKLAGMTGTAMTEANEFNAIYSLQVVAIPPNRPVVRADLPDLIYGSEKEKFEAIAKEIEELHQVGQPVLVGTISVEVSERLSETLTRKGVPHNVLNARQHQREAEIVAGAGQFGAVTVATNMAGRGTDIILGRSPFDKVWEHWQKHDLAPKRLRHDADAGEMDAATVDCWLGRWCDDKAKAKAGADPASRLKAVNAARRQLGLPPLPLPSQLRPLCDVRRLGGLRIVGTERHDARRIDNQLRGRSGRQGDPGSSRFYLSLDDDLMKRFAGPMLAGAMRKMGLSDGIPIESGLVSRSVEKAQKRVEEYYYGIRKNLLEYDQVMNRQRQLIYAQRQKIIEGQELEPTLRELYRGALDDLVQKSAADGVRGPALAERLAANFAAETGLPAPAAAELPVAEGGDSCRDLMVKRVGEAMEKRKAELGELFPRVVSFVVLETIDRRWKDHIYAMDHLRHAIGLEAYAQKDPRLRYKEEGFRRFEMMNELIRLDVARLFFRLEVRVEQQPADGSAPLAERALAAGGFQPRKTPQPGDADTKPNDPCPCGSGRPYRRCHGK